MVGCALFHRGTIHRRRYVQHPSWPARKHRRVRLLPSDRCKALPGSWGIPHTCWNLVVQQNSSSAIGSYSVSTSRLYLDQEHSLAHLVQTIDSRYNRVPGERVNNLKRFKNWPLGPTPRSTYLIVRSSLTFVDLGCRHACDACT